VQAPVHGAEFSFTPERFIHQANPVEPVSRLGPAPFHGPKRPLPVFIKRSS
jgi:hypothetical protein